MYVQLCARCLTLRVVCTAPYRVPASGSGRSPHWFPIRPRMIYEVAAFTFTVRVSDVPVYQADLIFDYTPSRTLRSNGKDLLIVQRFKRQLVARTTRVAAPRSTTTADNFLKHLATMDYLGPSDYLYTPKTFCRDSETWRLTSGF